jgi:hypothetical protein
LDRGIYRENFNRSRRGELLKGYAEDIELEKWRRLEQRFVLKARRPGVSARKLANQYGLEELRDYLDRTRRPLDARRGWKYEVKVLFPDLDAASLKALSSRGSISGSSETARG